MCQPRVAVSSLQFAIQIIIGLRGCATQGLDGRLGAKTRLATSFSKHWATFLVATRADLSVEQSKTPVTPPTIKSHRNGDSKESKLQARTIRRAGARSNYSIAFELSNFTIVKDPSRFSLSSARSVQSDTLVFSLHDSSSLHQRRLINSQCASRQIIRGRFLLGLARFGTEHWMV